MACQLVGFSLLWLLTCTAIRGDHVVQNTTVAATNIESTIGTPALLINPTSITSQNTTDGQYETILKISPFSNATNEPDEATTMQTILNVNSTEFIQRKSNSSDDEEYDEIEISPQYRSEFAKQFGLPSNPFGFLVNRTPCECTNGVCGCCTGMLITALRQFGCVNITYHPEDFSFEFKMLMNDAVLYKSRVTGRNPPPVCVRVPRFTVLKVCTSFYDLYFVGRNMHVCMEMGAYFRDSEIFNRSFDCMRIGDKGVAVVKPEDGGLFHKPGTDAEIDAGFDDIEDYDENAVVRRRRTAHLNL